MIDELIAKTGAELADAFSSRKHATWLRAYAEPLDMDKDEAIASSLSSILKEYITRYSLAAICSNNVYWNVTASPVQLIVTPHDGKLLTLVNSSIISHSDETLEDIEGCGSLGGLHAQVERYKEVAIRAYVLERGEMQDIWFHDPLESRFVQHEFDHTRRKICTDLGPVMRFGNPSPHRHIETVNMHILSYVQHRNLQEQPAYFLSFSLVHDRSSHIMPGVQKYAGYGDPIVFQLPAIPEVLEFMKQLPIKDYAVFPFYSMALGGKKR